MALPLPPGLTPHEVAFLCEMEMITVIPRQRLERLELLGGTTSELNPPYRSQIPLWFALLLKRQQRANIVPPPWLRPASLTHILELETDRSQDAFSPPPKLPPTDSGLVIKSTPFLSSATAGAEPAALPYHWLELGEILLDAAPDDFEEPDQVRRLMRDLRDVRMAKLRAGVEVLDAAGSVKMNGVGGMEVAEGRAFITGVIDGLRKIAASREQARRERYEEEGSNGMASMEDEDDAMDL